MTTLNANECDHPELTFDGICFTCGANANGCPHTNLILDRCAACGLVASAAHPELMPSAQAREVWLNGGLGARQDITYEKCQTPTGRQCQNCGHVETLGDLMTWKSLEYLVNGELACPDCRHQRKLAVDPRYRQHCEFWYGPEQSTGSLGQNYFSEVD